ncbi:MAG: hypothetical protein K6C36_09910, partial [Clostridia bacterium]|nr:hypothetical protein [Clostridia bacterium]
MKLSKHIYIVFIILLASLLPVIPALSEKVFFADFDIFAYAAPGSVCVASLLLSVYGCFTAKNPAVRLAVILILTVPALFFNVNYIFLLFPIPVSVMALLPPDGSGQSPARAGKTVAGALCALASAFVSGIFQWKFEPC